MIPSEPTAERPKSPLLRGLFSFEDGLISLVVLVMTALPVASMIFRGLFGGGIPGSQTIVQHLTLWAAFLGALLTTREGKHLSLSTAELLPAGRPRRLSKLFTHTVAAGTTALLALASLNLVMVESEGDQKLIGDIPEWWSEVVMPVALLFMALRLVWRASDAWGGRLIALAGTGAAFALGLVEESPEVLLWPVGILIMIALLAGAPIYVAMSGLAMLFFYASGGAIGTVPGETLRLVVSPTLPAIPLLTVAGFILGEGGAAKRLVRVCRAWIGWMPGGMAIMVCLVCAVFTAFTGGSGVTILALGGLVLPILIEEKYPEGFSLGLVTASGSLGLLFPPSLPVLLYSVVAEIPDLNQLYLAGLVPGIVMILFVCLYGVYVGIREKTPRTRFDLGEAGRALWEAKWELGLPLVMGVSILGGLATIVEAAALAAAYAIAVEVFIFRDIPVRQLPKTIVHGATLVGSVLIVLGVALGLTYYLVDAQIFDVVIAWMREHVKSPIVFLLVLNAVLLVLGSVLEIYSAVVILAPLIAKLGEDYQINKIHLAIVFLANLELGFLFPPVGLNLFLSSSRFEKPLPHLYRNAFPFLVIMTLAVLLVTYVPGMTTGVLELFGLGEPPTLAAP